MEWTLLLGYLAERHPIILIILIVLGTLVILAQIYIALTPTKKDDALYAKLESMPVAGALLKALSSFAPIQRKQK